MSKKYVQMDLKCAACKEKISATFQYPGFMDWVTVPLHCKTCDSQLIYKFARADRMGQDGTRPARGTLQVKAKILQFNPFILKMLKEEQEWNSKPFEEQNAELA